MNVGIVGLGIGGACLALRLARTGHVVTVFEQAPSPGPVGAGLLLQPSGQAVLRELGLLDEVAARSWPITTFHADKARGRSLATLRYDRRDAAAAALGVSRGVLFMALFEGAIDAGATVVAGTRIVDVIEAGEEATVVDDGGHVHGPFDLVVIANGAQSELRTRIDPASRFRLSAWAALWFLASTDADCPTVLHQQARGTTVLCGILPVAQRQVACFWGVRADGWQAVTRRGWAAFVEDVAVVMPEARPLLEQIGGFDQLTLTRYGRSSISRRHTARLALIGDAAHATPPHLGQGANLALLDAAALSEALASEKALDLALDRWDRARSWQNRRYGLASNLLAPTFQSGLTWLGPLRDLALPMMCRVPPIRDLMERVLAGRG